MPSRLRRAIGAVKDQTSIGLAKVPIFSGGVSLDVPILRATSHDESPVDPRHVADIIRHVASDRDHAAACAEAIARRLARSRSWVVALKSLTLLLGVFHASDPNFPREVRRVMKVVNISTSESSSAPSWDCAAFVRAFALYIDERIHCRLNVCDEMRSLNPAALIHAVSHRQKLLDRAIATRPAGDALSSRLVLTSLRAVVRESFGLYRDLSDGLALLLDAFFRLPYQSCVSAFQACVRASRQFEELTEFYLFCKTAGVGRTSEYPSVQRISAELLETLHEFLKDHATTSFSVSPVGDFYYGAARSDGGSDGSSEGRRQDDHWEFPTESEVATEAIATRPTLERLLFDQEIGRSEPVIQPTFSAENPYDTAVFCGSSDPFETAFGEGEKRLIRDEAVVSVEQRLWLENQKKIIAKRITTTTNEFLL